MTFAYLNGEYLSLSEAKISPMDRGFLLADGVYEVIPVYQGKLFGFDRHMKRLWHGLKALGIHNPLSDKEWQALAEKLIAQSGEITASFYMQITRGVEMERNHYYHPATQPTTFAYINKWAKRTIDSIPATSSITLPDDRWSRCDIKSISLLPNAMARQKAHEKGCTEALLIRNGTVNEGASSNVFMVKDGIIMTPAVSQFILSGTTREIVLELAHRHGLHYQERYFNLEELYAADEVWITSVLREIQPVIKIDDRTIGTGKAGPIWRTMIQYYYDYIQENIHD